MFPILSDTPLSVNSRCSVAAVCIASRAVLILHTLHLLVSFLTSVETRCRHARPSVLTETVNADPCCNSLGPAWDPSGATHLSKATAHLSDPAGEVGVIMAVLQAAARRGRLAGMHHRASPTQTTPRGSCDPPEAQRAPRTPSQATTHLSRAPYLGAPRPRGPKELQQGRRPCVVATSIH